MNRAIFERGHVRQTHGVCVLLSYVVAAYPHTQRPPSEYMMAYCQEYGRTYLDSPDAERLVGCYFQADACAVNANSGYDFIQRVHNTLTQEVFCKARRSFDIAPLEAANRLAELQAVLRADPAKTVMLSWNTEDRQHPHSIAIAFDVATDDFLVANPIEGALSTMHGILPPPTDATTGRPLIIGDVLILSPRVQQGIH